MHVLERRSTLGMLACVDTGGEWARTGAEQVDVNEFHILSLLFIAALQITMEF